MPREHIKVYQERPPLSIWFWILPLFLLAAFLTFFFIRRHHAPPTVMAQPVATNLPDLGSLTFVPGQPSLAEDGQATLDRAAEAMRGNPNVLLRVEGYAPPRSRPTRSGSLAQQRALAVANYLEAKGIDRSRLTGATRTAFKPLPIADPSIPSGDRRRAELYIQ